jgi:gentisate 1,2-dioxygenase
LTNPGLGGRLQVTSTMRCAVSIYNPGDVAPVHIHTPNASRTILSNEGGYTTIDGERCEAARGDLILDRTAPGTITAMTAPSRSYGSTYWISR